MAAAVAAALLCEGYNYTLVRTFHLVEDEYAHQTAPLDTNLPEGPLRGIYTTSEIAAKYTAAMTDLDRIRAASDGPLYVADLCPWYYLYAEKPIGAYAAFYVPVDSETRQVRYWQLHPNALPTCIYVPFFNCDDYETNPAADEKLAFFGSLCDYELAEGQAGYILTVTGWHLPETLVEPGAKLI